MDPRALLAPSGALLSALASAHPVTLLTNMPVIARSGPVVAGQGGGQRGCGGAGGKPQVRCHVYARQRGAGCPCSAGLAQAAPRKWCSAPAVGGGRAVPLLRRSAKRAKLLMAETAERRGSALSQCLAAPPPPLTRASPLSQAARSRSGVPVTKPQRAPRRCVRTPAAVAGAAVVASAADSQRPSPPPSPPAPRSRCVALAQRGTNAHRVRRRGPGWRSQQRARASRVVVICR